MAKKPLAIDLFCGLGGWTEGLLAEGYDVVGFDIEQHVYGEHRYPGLLVIQDVLTLHGSQFRTAALIVASPPCQEYSYMAMPWKAAKAKASAIRADTTGENLERLNRLFNACFRIQREACEAAGRHIPMIVENVRGANAWVGRSRWNFGSFHFWGDVPALMPSTIGRSAMKGLVAHRSNGETNFHGYKSKGMNWSDRNKRGQDFTRVAGAQALEGLKNSGGSWFAVANNTTSGTANNARDAIVARMRDDGIKNAGHLNKRDGHSHTPHLTNTSEHQDDSGTKLEVLGSMDTAKIKDREITVRNQKAVSLPAR